MVVSTVTRLVVSRQKFPAMRTLIEQLGLPIDKVGSSQDVEFLGIFCGKFCGIFLVYIIYYIVIITDIYNLNS